MSTGTGGSGGAGGAGAAAGPGPIKLAITPRKFSGEDEECSREFMELFDQAASSNRWLPDTCVTQFPNYLTHTASKWWRSFKNQRSRAAAAAGTPLVAPTWAEVVTAFQAAFEPNDVIGAELRLDARKQRADETPEQYVFDIISLCERVDKDMIDERRVRYLLRNLKEYYLSRIMPLDPKTPEDFLVHMRRIAEMKKLTDRAVNREARAFPVAEETSLEMREMVKQTQRLVEEIQEQRRQDKAERELRQQQRRRENRTEGPRCYNCNMMGHIAKDCRKPQNQSGRLRDRGPTFPPQARRVQFDERGRSSFLQRGGNNSAERNNFAGNNFRQNVTRGSGERYNGEERVWRQAENRNAGETGQSPARQGPEVTARW